MTILEPTQVLVKIIWKHKYLISQSSGTDLTIFKISTGGNFSSPLNLLTVNFTNILFCDKFNLLVIKITLINGKTKPCLFLLTAKKLNWKKSSKSSNSAFDSFYHSNFSIPFSELLSIFWKSLSIILQHQYLLDDHD